MLEDKRTAYAELIALTQLFIFREHVLQKPVAATPETYTFFKPLIPIKTQPQPKAPHPIPSPKQPPLPSTEPSSVKSTLIPPKQIIPSTNTSNSEPSRTNDKEPETALTRTLLTLEPLAPATSLQCQEFKPLLQELFPYLTVHDHTPSDQHAHHVKNRWQLEQKIPPIILLAFDDRDHSLTFLKNIAKAISLHFAPARVLSALKIEQEEKWETLLKTPQLRLIIAGDYGLYTLSRLMKYYKTDPRSAKHFIDTVPLLLLSDPSIYIKEPQLKPLLWRAICTELSGYTHAKGQQPASPPIESSLER